jgi:hypothetical protein
MGNKARVASKEHSYAVGLYLRCKAGRGACMHLALRVTFASSSASASGLPSVATARPQWRSAERATTGLAPAPTSSTLFPAHGPAIPDAAERKLWSMHGPQLGSWRGLHYLQ